MTRCGKFLFVFSLIFTAVATCSFFFPLVRAERDAAVLSIYQYYGEEKVPLWHVLDLLGTNPYPADAQANATTSHVHAYVRANLWSTNCKLARIAFIVSTITATVGTAFSGIVVITLSVYCCKMKPGKARRVASVSTFFATFGFLLLAVSVTMIAALYSADACIDDTFYFRSLKTSGYRLVEGFGLLCAATGGMFLSALFHYCS